jgi:DNA replication and repair protein RecF
MVLTKLEVEGFRNLQSQAVQLHPRFNLIVGQNGQGKTNLLEAVVVLGQLRSFRAGRSSELLRFGERQARLRGLCENQGLKRELEVQLRAGGRRALLDGKTVPSATAYLGKLAAVIFAAEDLQLPRGAPAERRRLLDRAIAGCWPAYYELQRAFQKVLSTRNRVLRDRSSQLEALLGVYDLQLAELGSRVVASRRRYVRSLGARLQSVFADVSRSGVQGGMVYRSRGEVGQAGDALEALKEALLGELGRARAADLTRQTTTVGPQADDLELQLDGRPAGAFGSQGQLRSLVIALKLAQIQDSFERVGSYPLLLLDDVSSELDPDRNEYLFDFIKKISCQTFVTSTRPELLPVDENHIKFHVVNGMISPLSLP